MTGTVKSIDFNDMLVEQGLDATRSMIQKQIETASQEDLINKKASNIHQEDYEKWPNPLEFSDQREQLKGLVFPMEALPEKIRNAATEVARFTKTDAVGAVTVGLSVVATAIGKKARVNEREGLSHFPSMFFMPIAESGERKSAIFKLIEQPLAEWEKKELNLHKKKDAAAQAHNFLIDSQVDGLKKQGKKSQLAELELEAIADQIGDLESKKKDLPPVPKLYDSDITEQRLVVELYRHGGAFAVLTPEGRPLVDHILGKYSGGDGMHGDAVYLAGISGDRITRNRVGNENGSDNFVIFDPCLNVCAMIQPDKFRQLAGSAALRDSGLVARIWPVRLRPMVGFQEELENEPGLDHEALLPFFSAIENVLKHDDQEQDEEPHIHKATLSNESAELRRQFNNRLQILMRDDGDLNDVRAIVAKWVTQTVKLALIFHIIDDPEQLSSPNSEIDAETWRSAQTISEFYLEHAITESRSACEDALFDKARKLLDWVKRLPADESGRRILTRRLVLQSSPRPRPTASETDDIMSLLVDFGYVRKLPTEGRSKPPYEVHPSLYK